MMLPDHRKEKLISETQLTASRSGGPGGQNVNKVSTKIELRFPVENSSELSEKERQIIATKLKNRISSEGILIVTSSAERSQWMNRQKAETKFIELLETALTLPKRRKKTGPTKASQMKRVENKKKHAQKKILRKPPDF